VTDVVVRQLSDDGIWRVGRSPDPYEIRPALTAEELNHPKVGNRFDSPIGNYGVLYFGTELEACFGETLARFRPSIGLAEIARGEWSDMGLMAPGTVPADWRQRRLAVRATTQEDVNFLDVEELGTREVLNKELGAALATLGVTDLDVSVIRSGDRRITRLISLWAWSQTDDEGEYRFGGLCYLSRINTDWECWALFSRTATTELERRVIPRNTPELEHVADMYGITVF
jgi:RES domain